MPERVEHLLGALRRPPCREYSKPASPRPGRLANSMPPSCPALPLFPHDWIGRPARRLSARMHQGSEPADWHRRSRARRCRCPGEARRRPRTLDRSSEHVRPVQRLPHLLLNAGGRAQQLSQRLRERVGSPARCDESASQSRWMIPERSARPGSQCTAHAGAPSLSASPPTRRCAPGLQRQQSPQPKPHL